MEYSVMKDDVTVGVCTLEEMGLYWLLRCQCDILSDRVERLYAGQRRLGVLEKEADRLTLTRRLSKSSCPEIPPKSGVFTLHPVKETLVPWEGTIKGYELKGFEKEECILFPYTPDTPCPCEPLFCFFEIKDGYWQLPKKIGCFQ